jgi:tRNA pseudouridine38-40 synthase
MQPGKATIQSELSNALELILNEKVCLTGAGRTDTGVHAINYIAHFNSETLETKDLIALEYKLNRFLSWDILIQEIIPVENGAHARFDAISRTYHFLISTKKNPFLHDFSLYYPQKLDIDIMNSACTDLLTNSDFASFSKLHGNNKTTICDVREAEWRQVNPELIVFRITADRFLRNMVRSIVGTMLGIGTLRDRNPLRVPIPSLQSIIDKKDRSAAGTSVNGKGLFLSDIGYKNINFSPNKYHLLNESFFF